MPFNDYRDLDVWQVSMDLAIDCYRSSSSFPNDERYGLTSQLRRAAVSVPANIAEGYGRYTTKSYLYHLSVSSGSLKEVETHLLIARRLQYLAEKDIEPLFSLTSRVGRMLTALRRSLESNRIE